MSLLQGCDSIRRRWFSTGIAAPFGMCAVLVLVQWWPGLAHGRNPTWGDTLPLGWPLMQLQADALRGHGSMLWSNGIYGGHPVFAEGQGGFAHPLNLLLALLVTPRLGAPSSAVLLHVTDLLCMALGMLLLGRRLGLGAAANGVAALGVVFAPAILLQQNNIAIGGTLGFAPLSLWALERCLAEPSRRSAVLLAAMLSLVFLAGYPQTLHGLLIVMAGRIAVPVLVGLKRRLVRRNRAGLAGAGLASAGALAGAAVLFLGLTAVQSLPLAQLIALSHRAGGVALSGALGWRRLVLGCAMGDLTASGGSANDAFGIGSLLVWAPATLVFLVRSTDVARSRIAGYAAGAVVCMLAAAGDTPLFPLLHGGLLPGMRFFRITVLYPAIAAMPVALLAGVALERWHRMPRGAVALVAACWLLILLPLRPVLAPVAIGTAAAALLLLLRLPRTWSRMLPRAVLALLLVEVATLRLHPFPFRPASVLAVPDMGRAIREAAPEPADRRFYGTSLSAAHGLMLPQAPSEPAGAERMLASLSPMTGLPRDIPSLDGALALPLRRRMLAEPLLAAGLDDGSGAGARLIDLLAVRFLVSDRQLAGRDLVPVREGGIDHAWLYRNRAARPWIQGYAGHRTATDAADAARRLADARTPTLVIEDPAGRAPKDASNQAVPEIAPRALAQTMLRFDVRAEAPGWVVVADSPYPGWSATIDGRPAPVFPAQLLAKAVPVPAGRHVLVLRYRSLPFEVGLAISLLSLLLCGVLLKR